MSSFTSFRDVGFRRRRAEEDEDPMSGLGNLADCMLVLACGLMVALVTAWNIDITQVTEVTETDDAQEISSLESITDDVESGGSAYIDMGRVYQDPETGKLYMVESATESGSDDESGTSADSSEASASASQSGASAEGGN